MPLMKNQLGSAAAVGSGATAASPGAGDVVKIDSNHPDMLLCLSSPLNSSSFVPCECNELVHLMNITELKVKKSMSMP
jgi:hypothetical protein